MAWNQPGGNGGRDPWGNRGDQQGPPDLDEVLKKLRTRLGRLFGGRGRGGGSGGGFRLPGGSDRFLVSEQDLLDHTRRLGAELLDPIKTTNVQGQRCMTTWVLRKR